MKVHRLPWRSGEHLWRSERDWWLRRIHTYTNILAFSTDRKRRIFQSWRICQKQRVVDNSNTTVYGTWVPVTVRLVATYIYPVTLLTLAHFGGDRLSVYDITVCMCCGTAVQESDGDVTAHCSEGPRKILISSQPIDRFWRNLACWSVLSLWTRLANKILRIRQSSVIVGGTIWWLKRSWIG